jgi:hypothetical protein
MKARWQVPVLLCAALSACASFDVYQQDRELGAAYVRGGFPGLIDTASRRFANECGTPGKRAVLDTHNPDVKQFENNDCRQMSQMLAYGLYQQKQYAQAIPYLEQIALDTEYMRLQTGDIAAICTDTFMRVPNPNETSAVFGDSPKTEGFYAPAYLLNAKKALGMPVTKDEVYAAYVCPLIRSDRYQPRDESGFLQDLQAYGSPQDVANARVFLSAVAKPLEQTLDKMMREASAQAKAAAPNSSAAYKQLAANLSALYTNAARFAQSKGLADYTGILNRMAAAQQSWLASMKANDAYAAATR